MVSSTVQSGVLNGTPIVARNPPPEGQMAVQIPIELTPSIFAANGLQQLSSGQVGGMSQVVTLMIDNTRNNNPVTVTHGALNETVTIAANTLATVPTFSGQGYWPWEVSLSAAPAMNVPVTLIMLNYERSAGLYRQTSNTIQNTGENSTVLYSGVQVCTANGNFILNAAGPSGSLWVLDSLEMAIDLFGNNNAGAFGCNLELICGIGGVVVNTIEATGYNGGAGGLVFGAVTPSYRTWSQGLLVNSNAAFYLNVSAKYNLAEIDVRINLSGYNVSA